MNNIDLFAPKIAISFLTSLVACIILTPAAMKLSERFGIMDKPSPRKIHNVPKGRLGGLAIYFSFMIGLFVPIMIGWPLKTSFVTSISLDNSIVGFLISSLVIVILGVLDDKYDLKPGVKFLVQIVAAFILVVFGLKIEVVSGIQPGTRFDPGFFKVPITVFWIVALTNMINFIDGLDGLASGITAISAVALIVVNYLDKLSLKSCVMLAAMAGAGIGFLLYNFHPAKIFMGDCGATFLGFTLGVTSVMGAFKSATFAIVLVPFLALLIPIFDMVYAVFRRIVREMPPHIADKEHLHHQFLELGLSHPQAVAVLYLIAMGLAFFSAFVMPKINNIKATFLLLLMCLLFVVGMIRIRHFINSKNKRKNYEFNDSNADVTNVSSNSSANNQKTIK